MSNLVSKDHAIIHKMTVEIKALTIGKKQVTQSVFRQLPERDVWDILEHFEEGDYLKIYGQIWGYVRYQWKGSGNLYGEWIVWTDGKRLYRCEKAQIKVMEIVIYGNRKKFIEEAISFNTALETLDQLFIAV